MNVETMGNPRAGGVLTPMLVTGGMDIAAGDARYLKKNGPQVAVTDFLQLGVSPVANGGAIVIDADSFAAKGNVGLSVSRSGTAEIRVGSSAALGAYIGTTGVGVELYLNTLATSRWAIQATAGISSITAKQTTARIVGGSLNGFSVRNSGDARDNFNVADNGSVAYVFNGTSYVAIGVSAVTGERTAGGVFSGGGLNDVWLSQDTNGVGRIVGATYHNGAQYYSLWEGANVAGGGATRGTLELIKAGGQVVIARNAAYGAGFASLRLDGLTSGAGAAVGTLNNAPAAGNPAFWCPVSIAGVVRYFPCW